MPVPSRISDACFLQTFEKIRNGLSVSQAARELGVSASLLYHQSLRLTGTSLVRQRRPGGRSRISDAVWIATFERLRRGEVSALRAARELGVCDGTLRYHHRRMTGRPVRVDRRVERPVKIPPGPRHRAYIAGIVDGEGWISRSSGARSRGAHVAVANTDRGLIEYLAGFGGLTSSRPGSTQGRIKSAKPQFLWRVTARRQVVALLDAIEPYMVIKRDLARRTLQRLREWIALDYKNSKRARQPFRGFSTPVDLERRGADHDGEGDGRIGVDDA